MNEFLECPIICPENNDPICGTDGVDYKNLCHLKDADCKNTEVDIKFEKAGSCAEWCSRPGMGTFLKLEMLFQIFLLYTLI